MSFPLYFRRLRRHLGITQTEMADRLGITQGCLSKIESGAIQEPGALVYRRAMQMVKKIISSLEAA